MIDAPGGTGKTFVVKTIVKHIGLHECILLASSGIAALSFPTGSTTHSAFKIPIVDIGRGCSLSRNAKQAERLRQCELAFWDEISMVSYKIVEAVSKLFQLLLRSKEPFGGKKIVRLGDFRQILPVVKKGSPQDVIAESCARYKK